MSDTRETPAKRFTREILHSAGIHIDGADAHDMQVHDERVFGRAIRHGSLGLGEAYMDGWWDCDALDEFFARLLRSNVYAKIPLTFDTVAAFLRMQLLNLQTISGAKKVAKLHYDLGNDFYEAMLDPFLQYSCGYFKDTTDLKTAQEQKLDLICRKLQLKKDDRLLDIGCGWGGLAKFAASNYGCSVVGVNISERQVAHAREFCKGLPVEIKLMDYRDIHDTFDKIVSVGMFEHVGPKNYRTYFETAYRCLKDNGLFLLHTIGNNVPSRHPDPWIERYIFPHSILPSAEQIMHAKGPLLVAEDMHNFGAYYDKTLMAWHANFERAWPRFSDRFDERFRRMWRYYLLSCAGAFRARQIQLYQIVFSKKGIEGGYASVR